MSNNSQNNPITGMSSNQINTSMTSSTTNTTASTLNQIQQQQTNASGLISIEYNHQTFQSWLDLLVDYNVTEENKLKVIQDISYNLEILQTLPTHVQLIKDAMAKFMRILNDTEPHFIAESAIHQLRKRILEIIQRLSQLLNTSTHFNTNTGNFNRDLIQLIYRLIETENEDNVTICIKIIIDHHRYLKTIPLNNEVQQYFNFVKKIYSDLIQNIHLVFNYKPQLKVHDITEINMKSILSETYSSLQITIEKANAKDNMLYNIIPRGTNSLKVLIDCPINTVMMYQMNKSILNQEIGDVIALVANVITLQPPAITPSLSTDTDLSQSSLSAITSSLDSKEVYCDFITVQVKALSFLVYFKSYQDFLTNNADLVVNGILQLFRHCPPEVISIRKDLLGISRHILTDLRAKFLPHISQFFDEATFCGTGYTASESLRTNACSIVADFVHNVRKQLSYSDLCRSVTYFSKSLHDPLLHTNLHNMCCRVLLNLIDCIKTKDIEMNNAVAAAISANNSTPTPPATPQPVPVNTLRAREFILKILEVLVLKFKSIARYQVKFILLEQNKNETLTEIEAEDSTSINKKGKSRLERIDIFLNTSDLIKSSSSSLMLTVQQQQQQQLSEADCRTAIKFLILACRSITAFLLDTKLHQSTDLALAMLQPKQLTPRETLVYIKFLKNALLAMDVYMMGQKKSTPNSLLQKEEKEVLENLGQIFSLLHVDTLKEIFSQTIKFLIERTFVNPQITILSSYLLATPATSFTFATILIEHLLQQMSAMGNSSVEHSALYLRLFKLVFGSVSVFPVDNEKMLKPHLHTLVTRSLELALRAKEPYNYFLLLRALFRSIGGGNHDLLYQEFLPLLPVLLQSLNELQTGLHRQHLKDLFVELCLTVPVRLSSLLPYLPMLMDPLVSALNGSATLVSQGLRTLELCVDNLQPEFLYDHIEPVRTDLIQGLWRTLRSGNELIAQSALRVLGKLGGSNRKLIVEPQLLKYNQNAQQCCKEFSGPTIQVSFVNYQGNIELSLEKCLQFAQQVLKTQTASTNSDLFYKRHAFKIISSVLLSLVKFEKNEEGESVFLNYKQRQNSTPFTDYLLKVHRFDDTHLRQMCELTLVCLFHACQVKELHVSATTLLDSLCIQLTLISLAHYSNEGNQNSNEKFELPQANIFRGVQVQQQQQRTCLDCFILLDCFYSVLCSDDTMEQWPQVQRALLCCIETSELICNNPFDGNNNEDRHLLANEAFFNYLSDRVLCQLCYERSWCAKKAACQLIAQLCARMPLLWTVQHCYAQLRALFNILVAVMGEISSGAIQLAQDTLMQLIKCSMVKLKGKSNSGDNGPQSLLDLHREQLELVQSRCLADVVRELIRQLTSANIYVREQARLLLTTIATEQHSESTSPLYALVQPYLELLTDVIGPRKHLKLRHYPVQAQLGLLYGLEFCSSTQPQQLFTLQMNNADHAQLFQELLGILECGDDAQQLQRAHLCYKSTNDLTPLRQAALSALASQHHLLEQRELILSTLHRALASANKEIQQHAFVCLKKFVTQTEAYSAQLRQQQQQQQTPDPAIAKILEQLRPTLQIAADYLRDYLHPLNNYTFLTSNVVQHLSYITQLYPTILNEKFSEYLLSHLRHWLDDTVEIANENTKKLNLNQGQQMKSYDKELQLCSNILQLLAELQSAPAKLVDTGIAMLMKYERVFMLEVNGQFRQPFSHFLRRYPFEALKFLLHPDRIKDMYLYRFTIYLFKKQPSFALIFKSEPQRLVQMLNESKTLYSNGIQQQNNGTGVAGLDLIQKSNKIQFLTILIIYRLMKSDVENKWLVQQSALIDSLLGIWCDERFHQKHQCVDQLEDIYWKEPVYLVQICLRFHSIQMKLQFPECTTNYSISANVELLFKLLIAFQHKSLLQYEFLRLFFREQVTKTYPCQWKRAAFFTFVKIFNNNIGESQPAVFPAPTPNETSETTTAEEPKNSPLPSPATEIKTTPVMPLVPKFEYSQRLKANIIQFILIPCFQHCFENNQHFDLIGGSPQPDSDSEENLISVFINKVIDPPAIDPSSLSMATVQPQSDTVRIFLLQLSSLFVQYAHAYIHDVNNKKQGIKLRRLMTFAWPCLLAKNCVDPFNKYHGHLLLSHIIAKFAIHKRIVLQVFHSLLKAYAPEAKVVVREALEILTPSFPTRMEDGYLTLATWTKKILIEESQSVPQLSHMLYIIVRYQKVYYLIRHTLINQMLSSMQKVGLTANATVENRVLAIDLTECILRWEAQRVKELCILNAADTTSNAEQKHQLNQLLNKHQDMLKPFEKNVSDCIMNSFIKVACLLHYSTTTPVDSNQTNNNNNNNTTDQLSKRCMNLLQTAIQNQLWPNSDIKLEVLDKILLTIEQPQAPATPAAGAATTASSVTPNYTSICTCLEIVTLLFENWCKFQSPTSNDTTIILEEKENNENDGILDTSYNTTKVQYLFRMLQKGLTACLQSTNARVVKSTAQLIQKVMATLPLDAFSLNNSTNLNASQSNTTTTTTPILTSPNTTTTAITEAEINSDSVYFLFGQPDGVLCKTIIDSLSYYEKSSILNQSQSQDSTSASTTSVTVGPTSFLNNNTTTNSVDVLTNCICLLRAAAQHNPQFIDRIMGSFMKVLQKLYRDHLSATTSGVLAAAGLTASTQAAAAATNLVYQLNANTTSIDGSNMLIINSGNVIQQINQNHNNAPASASVSTSSSSSQSNMIVNAWSELLLQCIELVKYRVGVMSLEMRKMFVNSILVTLLERSLDMRLFRYLLGLIAEWIKYQRNGPLINQIPSMKEKLILLQRLTQVMEKRFVAIGNQVAQFQASPTNNSNTTAESSQQQQQQQLAQQVQQYEEMQQMFLETVAFVYQDEGYVASSEFKVKLEQAFVLGLKTTAATPQIRQQFFNIFNTQFQSSDLYERLCYIIVTQNWECFGTHYWIKQCIQLTLGACAKANTKIRYSDVVHKRFHFWSWSEATKIIQLTSTNSDEMTMDTNEEETNEEKILLNVNVNLDEDEILSIGKKNKIGLKPMSNLEFRSMTNTFYEFHDDNSLEDTETKNQMKFLSRDEKIRLVLANQHSLFKLCSSVHNSDLLVSVCQLCHLSTDLSHHIWIQLFIQLFNLLSAKQQQQLYGELTPFVASGSHCVQQQQQQQSLSSKNGPLTASSSLSTLNTFVESFALAKPVSLFLRPSLLAYLAKQHNLWHRAILLLESSLLAKVELLAASMLGTEGTMDSTNSSSSSSYQQQHHQQQQQQQQNALQNVQHETFAALSQLYSQLREHDYKSGLWQVRAMHPETRAGLVYEQQGLYYQAQKCYEEVIAKAVDIYVSGGINDASPHNQTALTNPDELLEFNLWEERWQDCCRELNQWQELGEYARTKETDFSLSLECAWKQPQYNHGSNSSLVVASDWQWMKQLLLQQQKSNQQQTNVDLSSSNNSLLPRDQCWRWPLYQAYYLICNPTDCHPSIVQNSSSSSSSTTISLSQVIDAKVDRCMHLVLSEWRRLPWLVNQAHMQLLQAAQQIVEVHEAFQIQNNLLTMAQLVQQQQQLLQLHHHHSQAQLPTHQHLQANATQVLQEMKAVIKTWRTRLPLISDDLSYWNDVFCWRQYHYEAFTHFYEQQQANATANSTSTTGAAQISMIGVHALAQGIVHFGQVARKQHMYDLCLETLNKIHKKQSVPVIDCFYKVKQEIKCYIDTFDCLTARQAHEWLDVIEGMKLNFFSRENQAELISLKARFLQLVRKYDDANHLHSFSVQLNDAQPKLWGAWGDYLAEAFVNTLDQTQLHLRSMETAESALIALMHAARLPNSECRVRKYLSKVFWLLSYDGNKQKPLAQLFEQYASQVPAANWISWIPQLLTLLMCCGGGGAEEQDQGRYTTSLLNSIVRAYPLALYYPLRTLYLKLKNDEQTEKLKQHLHQQLLQKQHQQQSGDVEMKEAAAQPPPQTTTTTEALIRVTTLMHRQRETHPTLFNTLEGLIDQLLWLKVNWYEELLRNFKQTLHQCYALAFENVKNGRTNVELLIDPFSIIWFKKLHKFYADPYWDRFNLTKNNGSGCATGGATSSTALANNQNQRVRCLLAILNDPNYQLTQQKFLSDFSFQQSTNSTTHQVNLFSFMNKLKAWIRLFELHIRAQPSQQLLDERFRFVSQFCSSTADIEVPGEFLLSAPRHTNYYVKIQSFLPRVDSIEKYNSYSRRIYIRGHNGKVYPFLISNEANYYECRKEEHCMQLLRMCNALLNKQKETAKRQLHFTMPRVVNLSADVRLIEDDCAAISLLDIFKNRMRKLASIIAIQENGGAEVKDKMLQMSEAGDLPLASYFDYLRTKGAQMDNPNSRLQLYRHIAQTLVPRTVLKEWAAYTYTDATDYFHFRKLFTAQLAIYGLAEYVFCLTRVQPDQLYVSQSTGVCQSIRLRFDLNEALFNSSGGIDKESSSTNSSRLAPFRLTPNIVEFVTQAGINGPLTAIKIAMARCLVQPQYHFVWLLRAVIKDEILICMSRKKQEDSINLRNNQNQNSNNSEAEAETLINLVNKLVGQIDNKLKDCAALENGKNCVINDLIPRSMNLENLAQMDPLWYPWL